MDLASYGNDAKAFFGGWGGLDDWVKEAFMDFFVLFVFFFISPTQI